MAGPVRLHTASIDVAFPLLTRGVVDAVAESGLDANLLPWMLGYLLCTAGIALSIGGFIWMGGKVRTHVSHDIRRDGFENLQRLSFSFYDYRPVGWLMARMTSDCERLSNILAWGFLDLVWGGTMMLGIAIAMLVMNAETRDRRAADPAPARLGVQPLSAQHSA